jgi:hypothetical protein
VIVVNPSAAAPRLASLGFLADSDLGHRVDGGYLLVALRAEPSLHHFDPERVEYWLTADGRGRPARLTYETPVPIEIEFSWGTISIVDRMGVANDYLTFGGHLAADLVDHDLVAVFTSPAPLLKAGGHSQEWDLAGASVGAFFGRLLLAVDLRPGFEEQLAHASPLARYGAFIAGERLRYLSSPGLRDGEPWMSMMLEHEQRWLRTTAPDDCVAGERLWRECSTDPITAG